MNEPSPSVDASDLHPSPPARRGIGLPILAVVTLVVLAVPRIITHDLGLVAPGSLGNALLALVPLAGWVIVDAIWSTRPLVSLIVTGGLYGVALAVVHDLTWVAVFGDAPPRLGGNLEGAFSPAVEELLMRGAIVGSGLLTGLVTGVACGLIAWAAQATARTAGARLPLRRV